MEKINVLLVLSTFRELTGSELYVFEICKGLKKYGHDVSICAQNIGGILTNMAINEGINVFHVDSIPENLKFQIIHCQHTHITKKIINKYPKVPKICTIHSEIYNEENPVINSSIKRYIAIRPEIKEHIINKFFIPSELIEVIYNPVDDGRFNMEGAKDLGYYLFVGTIHNPRKMAIFDMIEKSKNEGRELWIVGKNHSDFLDKIINHSHVKYYTDTVDVEKFVKNCYQTSGIMMGRTTIEGWMCGKPGWIYNVDNTGRILNKELHEVPSDIDRFHLSNVSSQIIKIYNDVLY
jgi:hypothetical protein